MQRLLGLSSSLRGSSWGWAAPPDKAFRGGHDPLQTVWKTPCPMGPGVPQLGIVWDVLSGPWAVGVTRHWGEEGVPLKPQEQRRDLGYNCIQAWPCILLLPFLINHLWL